MATLMISPGVASAGYGGGSANDVWQVGLSFNCDSPTSPLCRDQYGNPQLGGYWGWAEFDAAPGQPADQRSGTGDGQFTGCGHSGAGGGGAGAGHLSQTITAWHEAPAGPNDFNTGGHVFWIDQITVTFTGHGTSQTFTSNPSDPNDPANGFLGDTGIPVEPGHYSFHPAPGVAGTMQVSYRPAS